MTDFDALERRRLRALVDADLDVAGPLHADSFVLVHPAGGIWTRDAYLGGIADGSIDYRRFEPESGIEVVRDGGGVAVVRYRSLIDIAVFGGTPGELRCWHLDVYERDAASGAWQVRWSQATEIRPPAG